MHKQKGFSLIELLIAIAIILIIAAIAIPNLLRARISANESSAVSGTRTLATAQMQYQASYPSVGYASSMANLAGTSCASPSSASACLVDQAVADASSAAKPKGGYIYGVSGTPSGFSVGTYPAFVGITGDRSFCASEDGVIRFDDTGANNSGGCGLGTPLQTVTH